MDKAAIMNGVHPIQILAAEKRSKAIPPSSNLFKEKAFRYMGESVLIWSLDEYFSDPKRRQDAIRKSEKYYAHRTLDDRGTTRGSTSHRKSTSGVKRYRKYANNGQGWWSKYCASCTTMNTGSSRGVTLMSMEAQAGAEE